MHFWKVNGAGNDFIILSALTKDLTDAQCSALAKHLCHRRLSIGADGLMIVTKPSGNADFRMLYYNADGTQGEMCGNGARCICRFGYELGLSGEKQTVETASGVIVGKRLSQRDYRIRLTEPSCVELRHNVEVGGIRYDCAYVELGNPGLPHAVLHHGALAETSDEELRELGRAICHHSSFFKGTNVNFYEVLGEDEVCLRTYERGVEDLTLACGTGAASAVTVLTLKGLVSGEGVKVHSPGGVLTVDMDRVGSHVERLYLTGSTNFVAEGEITDEDLPL